MNIRIKQLTMQNFKCFRDKDITFDSDITTIRGRNGEGKTTIADAILWCLFGKNTQGQSDFDLKTHGEDGKPIPHLDHSVEMELSADDSIVTLKRTLKETWVKKRGSDEQVFKNNTTEYLVNGDVLTAADYKKYIASLVSEEVFKAITNPNYFPSLKWQDQRVFLTRMVGNVEPEVIANTEELKALIQYLENSNDDIVAYRKHLSYQIKGIKDKLEKIPVRLEEQNKALPEKMDWDSISNLIEQKRKELELIENSILTIKQGNGSNVKRAEINHRIGEITTAIDDIKQNAYSQQGTYIAEKSAKVSQASLKFNEALNNQRLMDQTIEADKRMIERCEDSIKDFEKGLQRLRDEWPTQRFEISKEASYCPTCGQPLPADVFEEKVETMRLQFNQQKESKKQELSTRAAKIKQSKVDAENELKSTKDKLVSDEEALEKIKEDINLLFAEKAKLEKEPVKTADEILAENEGYVELSKQLSELKASLESVTDSDNNIEELVKLEAKKMQYEAEVNNYQTQLASKAQYERILSLIDGINDEEKDLVKQLSELERKEDVARQYESRQNTILEERINQHFKLVKWKMFKTTNNGGDPFDEPWCECFVDGVAYHDGLNQAARLNAGLDIIRTLCKFYNVTAPIVIDNSESNLAILETESQQIRLHVFDSELNLV